MTEVLERLKAAAVVSSQSLVVAGFAGVCRKVKTANNGKLNGKGKWKIKWKRDSYRGFAGIL